MAEEAAINARPCARLPTDSLARACRQSADRVTYLSHVLLSVVRPNEASNSLTAGTSIASVVKP